MNIMGAPTTARRDTPPLGVPVLTRGRHRDLTEGSCVMEYVSVLAGRRFSDHPDCTDPLLSWLARGVNDRVGDRARASLAGLAPGLIGTRVHRSGARGVVRAVVFGELATMGLAGAPHDPWFRELDELATAYLARRVRPPAPPTEGCPAAPGGRRRWQPLATFDRNFTFAEVCRALGGVPPEYRDWLMCEALTSGVARTRRVLSLPEVTVAVLGPSPATAPPE
ncbi:hypothetical protein LQ327_08235 [Actinomycetospora endophytica]|uniref:Uncharacterized protein n=1 Tax=Actinomycetospora endophytica TaxID=2291215 RepID=A0ABS8P629_9PSEU|nr:hypothetical protein [Actinomycetospora endophytica]MCD2193372.1 hypothetical protein [Actinomycetospora endophytica]